MVFYSAAGRRRRKSWRTFWAFFILSSVSGEGQAGGARGEKRGVWLRENGTICPFGVFPCFIVIVVQFEPNPCVLASSQLRSCWFFPCLAGIWADCGSWRPNSPFVLFDPQSGRLTLNPGLLFLVLFKNTKENVKNTKDFSRHANP